MSDAPTIADRLRRRVLVLSLDAGLAGEIQRRLPAGWEVERIENAEALGPWNEVLLYRFMVLDLDGQGAYDPLEVLETLRLEYQINLPVFCVGGDGALRGEAIAARADRALDREELLTLVPRIAEGFF